MALETLIGVEKIGGFEVVDVDDEVASGELGRISSDDRPIAIFHSDNTIALKIQNGPIKENGVNGCQVDTLIRTATIILRGLNAKFPSPYNYAAINSLDEAIFHLEARTRDREARGVEGTNQA